MIHPLRGAGPGIGTAPVRVLKCPGRRLPRSPGAFSGCRPWIPMVLGMLALASGEATAQPPAWYTAGVGGFNPNIPDFYQHQNFNPTLAGNNWEKDGGWCAPIAFSNALYDFTQRGYNQLLSPGITNNATWLTTAYGPAGTVNQGDLYRVATNYFGFGPQAYLNQAGNIAGTQTPLLQINTFAVAGNGKVSYFSPAAGAVVQTNESAFTFYDAKMRVGDDVLVKIGPGTMPAASHWWGNFHYLAGAGDRVANNTIFVADPNTNKGSEAIDNGWPNFNKTNPAILAGRLFAAGDPIPIPKNPAINNAASYNQYYTPLQLAGDKITDLSGAKFNYTGATVDQFNVITPNKAGVLFDGLWPNPNNNLEKTVLALSSPTEAVNGIFIAPASQVSSLSSLDSINLSGWTTSLDSIDPFGNTRSDGGVEFLSSSAGSDLTAGSVADMTLATLSSFVNTGFDLFLHYEGTASNDWDVQVYGQNVPSLGLQIGTVPEPSTLVMAGIACTILAVWCAVRKWSKFVGAAGALACRVAWVATLIGATSSARAGSILLTPEWLAQSGPATGEGVVAAADHFEKPMAPASSPDWTAEPRRNLEPLPLQDRASVAEGQGDWKAATAALEGGLKREPANVRVRQRLGRALFGLGRPAAAYQELKRASDEDAALESAAITMGWLYTRSGNLKKAGEWMAYAVTAAPDSPVVHIGRAAWLLEQGRADEAQVHAATALQLDPQSTGGRRLLGLAARVRKDFPRAETIFQTLAQESPGDAWVRSQLALVLAEQADEAKRRQALELAKQTARQAPQVPDVQAALGTVYYRLHRLDEAEKTLQVLLDHGHASSDTAYILARVRADRGHPDRATALLESALAAPGLFVFRNEARQWLDRLATGSN